MLWDEIKRSAERIGTDISLIFQEEVQKAILTALSRKELFNDLVFQGGTALRLFYGNPRFSEDLDFVILKDKDAGVLVEHTEHIREFVKESYPFLDEVNIKVQKDEKVKRLILKTRSENREQELRIHIEAFPVPSYDNSAKILEHRPFYPTVRVESTKEILCDKLVALIGRDYVKGRDLWDVYYLVREREESIEWKLVKKKLDDYGVKEINAVDTLKRCKDQGTKILDNEMKRFLPTSVYRNYKGQFDDIVGLSCDLLDEASGRL